MAERTHASIDIDAPPAVVLGVIADLSEYPRWSPGLREVEVLEEAPGPEGTVRPRRARLRIDSGPIRDTSTLEYTWDDDGVSWHLVEGTLLTSLEGRYTVIGLPEGLAAEGAARSRLTYEVTLSLGVPLPGLIRKQAERVLIDTALAGLKRRVEGS